MSTLLGCDPGLFQPALRFQFEHPAGGLATAGPDPTRVVRVSEAQGRLARPDGGGIPRRRGLGHPAPAAVNDAAQHSFKGRCGHAAAVYEFPDAPAGGLRQGLQQLPLPVVKAQFLATNARQRCLYLLDGAPVQLDLLIVRRGKDGQQRRLQGGKATSAPLGARG